MDAAIGAMGNKMRMSGEIVRLPMLEDKEATRREE